LQVFRARDKRLFLLLFLDQKTHHSFLPFLFLSLFQNQQVVGPTFSPTAAEEYARKVRRKTRRESEVKLARKEESRRGKKMTSDFPLTSWGKKNPLSSLSKKKKTGLPGLPPRGLQDRAPDHPRPHLRLLGAGPGCPPHGQAGAGPPDLRRDPRGGRALVARARRRRWAGRVRLLDHVREREKRHTHTHRHTHAQTHTHTHTHTHRYTPLKETK
jgi:ABC-type nickel/cobalt efflux system permease component RcnA